MAILKIGSLTSLLVNLSGDKAELIGKFLATFCFVLIFDLSIVKKLCSAHARGSVCKVWIELRVNPSKIQLVIILKLVGNLAYLVYVYCLFPRDHFGDFSVVAKINSTIYSLFFSGNTDLGQGRKIHNPRCKIN